MNDSAMAGNSPWLPGAILTLAGLLAGCAAGAPAPPVAASAEAGPAEEGGSRRSMVVGLDGDPAAERLSLASGFGPEPRAFEVPAGGDADAYGLGSDCFGRISRRPVIELDYTADRSPLNIYVASSIDTTLVVRLPNGDVLCNDDYFGHDPAVLMNNPRSGRYAIWVGSYEGIRGEATLHISEQPPDIDVRFGDVGRRPDVIFVPTPQAAVERMLELAEIEEGNVLYDLGCGDGRIVVTAARKYGIRAVGFDIDPQRVEESKANVRAAGVEHLVSIRHADIFTVDLSEADVVTMYLLPWINVALMPQLRELRPGSRIVSFDFDMEGAGPAEFVTEDFGASGMRNIYKWVVPWEGEQQAD